MLEIKEKKEYFVNNKTIEIYITKNDQIWFTINDLSTLFDRHHLAIRRYIKIIFEKVKISYGQNCKKMKINASNRPSFFYSLKIVKLLAAHFDQSVIQPLENFLLESPEVVDLVDDEIDTNNQIIIYDNGRITLNVNVSPLEETVWLSAKQIAKLF